MKRWRYGILPAGVVLGVWLFVGATLRDPAERFRDWQPRVPPPDVTSSREAIEAWFQTQWQQAGITPAERAAEHTVLRRLTLALMGTIPSLEELRAFDADTQPHRLERWCWRMLHDSRCAPYLAQRLSRSLIGADGGTFIVFRRDRFENWLTDQLRQRRPFDALVRDMLTQEGLWTGEPATNFVTQALNDGVFDANKLAGRVARVFLGQRIDCAQCHDHPFAPWKQQQFASLAACFATLQASPLGVHDDLRRTWQVTLHGRTEPETLPPQPPFAWEWWPETGTPRERLAHWVTHPHNRRFPRAVVNRAWGLMFGKPWHAPVDDLPDPPEHPDLLDLLAADFTQHDYDFYRLIFLITQIPPFRLSSQHSVYEQGSDWTLAERAGAVFPLVRLRPEQIIGAMIQAGSLRTIDRDSHLLVRIIRFFRELDFVREYGDLGEQELEDHVGTIPQALLRMNGRFAAEVSEPQPFSAVGRLTALAPSPAERIRLAYWCCLTREPTAEELAFFTQQFSASSAAPGETLQDLFWVLFNSPEFCWNH
ncbi:MAG: hypothetical protein KatS3mg114_1092 [Planctomycetaceae bacterium]|nr:MAG: hypothetical protein KatS3mg114_1092 [Planctomycetaceae bacterium]